MKIENDPYKIIDNNFRDKQQEEADKERYKNKDGLNVEFNSKEKEKETIKQFTKSREEAMNDAAKKAWDSNDEKLFENAQKKGANFDKVEEKLKKENIPQDVLEELKIEAENLAGDDRIKANNLYERAKKIYILQNKNLKATLEQLNKEEENPVEKKIKFVN